VLAAAATVGLGLLGGTLWLRSASPGTEAPAALTQGPWAEPGEPPASGGTQQATPADATEAHPTTQAAVAQGPGPRAPTESPAVLPPPQRPEAPSSTAAQPPVTAAPSTGPAATGAPLAADEPSQRPASARTRRRSGVVLLDVFPSAVLVVDGKERGEVSGKQSLSLPLGEHYLLLRHPHRSQGYPVDVRADSPVQVRFNAFGAQ
jgi:hypothetical protein